MHGALLKPGGLELAAINWSMAQKLFTSKAVGGSKNTCQHFLTGSGVQFLRENGVKIPYSGRAIVLEEVFQKNEDGKVTRANGLEELPSFARDTLQEGLPVVINGILYSPQRIDLI